jgi:hypothetical protein
MPDWLAAQGDDDVALMDAAAAPRPFGPTLLSIALAPPPVSATG